MFKSKKVLVTGGSGMIGRELVSLLIQQGAHVRVASLDEPQLAPKDCEFLKTDLTYLDNCLTATKGMDFVFHVAGIKGSPAMTSQKPASFFFSTISFNTNIIEASYRNNVGGLLFTSSVGVYSPADRFFEDDVWKTFPSPNDRFAGWAKRMGELQLEAYKIQYGWDRLYCVRPANVYGPYDNFDPRNAMVIPSLIHRIASGENPLKIWGDGSQIRDFIHARDVAYGILHVVEKNYKEPLNLGSGTGISIKELAETLQKISPIPFEISWDTSKPAGDKMRILDMSRANSIGYQTKITLADGLKETFNWYMENKEKIGGRYNVFTK